MADVASGLVVGGEAPADPFEAALESKGVTGGGSSAVASVQDGLTFGPQTTEPAVVADTSDAGTTEEPEGDAGEPLHENPDVAAYLEKFGGDPDKALAAAAEAQKLIGKQGNELGELRTTVAKLEGIVETIQAQPPAPTAAPVQWTQEQIADGLAEYGGLQLATWAANEAPQLLDAIVEAWAEDEPFKAIKFDREYQEWKTAQETAKATPPDPSKTEAYLQNQIETQEMVDAMNVVKADFPNFDEFAEHLNAALDASPKAIQAGVLSDDAEIKQESLKDVFERAERISQATLATDAKAAADAKRTAGKETARVIRGQAGTPAPPVTSAAEGDTEEAVSKFKQSILSAETTSVRDGLTYGKAS